MVPSAPLDRSPGPRFPYAVSAFLNEFWSLLSEKWQVGRGIAKTREPPATSMMTERRST
jgi:hypothetical protein